MRDHIVEIEQEGRFVSVYKGFLILSFKGAEIGKIPLDDVQSLICGARGATITTPALAELAQRGIPVVIAGEKYLPQAIVWPLDANHLTARRIRMQLESPQPLRKNLWKRLIQWKIQAQAEVLSRQGLATPSALLQKMARKVLSGDRNNMEATAAKTYWQSLFGDFFSRDNIEGYPVNRFLNYGYAILRSSMARAIAAAGLHPAIGMFHHNRFNPFCLVDDLMEPFRPVLDSVILGSFKGDEEMTPEIKKIIVSTLRMDMKTDEGRSPLSVCIQRLATSLAISFEENRVLLKIPLQSMPLYFEGTCLTATD